MQIELTPESRIRLLVTIINDEGYEKLNQSLKKIITRLNEYKSTNEKDIINYLSQAIMYIPLKGGIYSKILFLLKDNNIVNNILSQLTNTLNNQNDVFIILNVFAFLLECVCNNMLSQDSLKKFIEDISNQFNLLYIIILSIVIVYDGTSQKKFLVDIFNCIKNIIISKKHNFSEYENIINIIEKELNDSNFNANNKLLFLNIDYKDEGEDSIYEFNLNNPFDNIVNKQEYEIIKYPIKEENISENLFSIKSYEKIQKMILLFQIINGFKDNFLLCQKYINNIYNFYGIEKKEDDICLYNILPEVMMRMIINHKKDKNIITLYSSLTIQLIKGYNNNNNYEKEFTDYLIELITNSNFLCKTNIYAIQNFINFISFFINNLPNSKTDILNIDIYQKDKDENYSINYSFFKKCFAEKICNLITKEAFEIIANNSYSTILEEISLEPNKPEGLSKDFDIISESIKKKEKFSEFKSQLISEDGELIYNFIAAILITRSKTLSHLSETINLYNEDLYELKNKNANKFEMFIIKCIFDIFGNSSVHILFLIEKFYNKYLISHLNVLKFIFIEKFSQNKENLSNWIFYEIIDLSISNSKFLIKKISDELKNEQENLSKSDEDRRQDIIKKIEDLEAIQDKIKNENKCLCSEIFKRFNDLVQSYKRLGEEDFLMFIKNSISFFIDVCATKNIIDLNEWKENKKLF